jgi:hypothetical protein
MMRILVAVAVVFVCALPAVARAETLVRFTKPSHMAFNEELSLTRWTPEFESYGLVGELGDAFALAPGEYSFSVHYAKFSLSARFSVSEEGVEVLKTQGRPPCGERTSQYVESWRVYAVHVDDSFEIHFDVPRIARMKGEMQVTCSTGVGDPVKWVNVHVTSTPSGASIFVDGKKIGATDRTIVVPLRDLNRHEYVVVKMPGYASCIRRVSSGADDLVTVACTLRSFSRK